MNKIVNKIVLLLLGVVSCVSLNAQDKSLMNLHFVYIDHEVTTPINELCSRLRTLQEDATEVNDALIVYLSDGTSSIESFTNLKDKKDKNRDAEQSFLEVISALQDANSHDVTAAIDVQRIIDIFDEHNFIDNRGVVLYNSVIFDFYVGRSFWSLGNNEKVLAHLYHIFNLSSLPRSKFTLNIFTPKADHVSYKEGMPFGDNNIDDINNNVKILKY